MSRSDEVSPVYKTSDTTYQSPRLDTATHAQAVMGWEHKEIHDGSHYNYCDYQLTNAAASTIKFVVTTPNTTKWGHLGFTVYSSAGATIEVFEGTTGVSGGTSKVPQNNNRNSLNVSGFTIVKDPTITTEGTRGPGFLAGAGREAGMVSREKENVLKQNTSYLMKITSLANSNDISWCFEWYEHTSRTA